MPDAELWRARCEQRAELVEFVKYHGAGWTGWLRARPARAGTEAAAGTSDPDVLTNGFARRNATYKRISLLINDPVRALGLLSGAAPDPARPGRQGASRATWRPSRSSSNLFRFKDAPHVMERVVYLHEYDLGLAARLVRGCDVWLNLPRPPYEASGTSGMKAAVNGGLNLSVLDGWWCGGVRRVQRVGAAGRRRGLIPAPRTRGTRTPSTA